MLPFDYSRVVGEALPGSTVDRRSELRRCVAQWRGYEPVRRALFGQIGQAGYMSQPGTILLELGNSGFGRYRYALIVNGVARFGLVRGIDKGKKVDALLGGLLRTTTGDDWRRMQGDASSDTEDADCYFLTVTLRGGDTAQVAVYDLPDSSSALGRMLRALQSYVEEAQLTPTSDKNR
jgi:hypothetical protein